MKIAIAGYGVEGKSSYSYFSRQGHEVTILDERTKIDDLPQGAVVILGKEAFQNLEMYDFVVRTPSLPPKKLTSARKIWSSTNEFFASCPAPIIGVTGTKGKGTTVSLIASILHEAGKTVHVVGNIGTPALDILPKVQPTDIVVYELSSFQLWDIEKSPHVAVVLMIEPDHLNIHADFDDYVAAKGNIALYQSPEDLLIYHPSDTASARVAELSRAARKKRYLTPEGAYIRNGQLFIDDQPICRTNEVGLTGEYNLQNVCAAITASWEFTQDTLATAQAIREFKGLEHRLEFVATKHGVRFYNDSFSSAPTATRAALSAFKEPLVLIVGGFDKGIDMTPLVEAIIEAPNIKYVIAIGETKNAIASLFRERSFEGFEITGASTMTEIVNLAVKKASPGDVVLLSPGTASFDMFTNFYERGQKFKDAVRELAR